MWKIDVNFTRMHDKIKLNANISIDEFEEVIIDINETTIVKVLSYRDEGNVSQILQLINNIY